MLPSNHWARNFTVEAEDIEYITTLLLEKETPLTSQQLALTLIENRLAHETAALEERYKDSRLYNPALSYEMGQKLVFPQMAYATATIKNTRSGLNPEYGEFNVIQVEFDDDRKITREFAANLETPHKLNQENASGTTSFINDADLSADDIFNLAGEDIIKRLEERLLEQDELIYMARAWFPRDLLLDVNEGHLHLAEAVLDIAGGGPLATQDIIEQVGGLGSSPMLLQIFSMNYRLNQDSRFDEVGPTGEVLWYLTRLEPPEVLNTPSALRYTPIDYDRSLLTPSMLNLEDEIDDELSALDAKHITEGTLTLTYPHRRMGTLPLNTHVINIFPTARRTTHVWITLIDGQDDEEYTGWVVPGGLYVYGLGAFYNKHKLPIGAQITVSRASPGKIRIDFSAYRPRTEYIRLILPKGDQIQFENNKRAIGADYDDLMILGVDDLDALDALIASTGQQRKSLAAILRMIIPALAKLTPQGTAHAKTIYSAVNVLRRCPPGPILATLEANPDFQNVGGDYWKLRDE
ncbi:MAG: hypothetical protein H7Y09_08700 [Chitinophagaceae bacterium]|nr:hypothetical protein [Anaerolineae bacterium]